LIVLLKLRKKNFSLIFIACAITLFLGYSGITGLHKSVPQPPANAASGLMPTAANAGPDNINAQPVNGLESYNDIPDTKEEFFVNYRMQRQKSRGQEIEMLKEILNSPSGTDNFKKEAQAQLLNISKSAAKEINVENLIKAIGYKDAVVCVDAKSATAVIDGKNLSPAEESVIMETMARETGFGEQNITIITRE